MAEPTLKINNAAIARIAKSAEAQRIAIAAAEKVADAVRAQMSETGGDPDSVKVEEYQTDRRVAAVVVPAYAQAADGVISRGANAAGIHVTT
ncbi:hypothetical protein [Gordonia sp. KTR9]|uniref:hypothetical protein n=1 Tax=Gordonia sp. KTR9 TaxID=337191 RepID=UPI000307BC4A|nr:hypothetical protein [Gordonia sp. KTR9]